MDYFKEVMQFVKTRGNDVKKSFAKCLKHLKGHLSWADEVVLSKDFAPFSFFFSLRKEGQRDFCGGMIYYGPGEGGSGSPQFSVRIGEQVEEWTIHT